MRATGPFPHYTPWSTEWREAAIDGYVRGKIPHLQLDLGNACSLRCVYCDSPERTSEGQPLTLEEMEEVLDHLQAHGLQLLFVCGYGEPLEDPRFLPLLRSASQRGLEVSLFSNLQPAWRNSDLLCELARLRPCILAKCDTVDEGLFDRVLGRRGSARKVFEVLEALVADGFVRSSGGTSNLGLSIVPTSLTVDAIPDVLDLALELGAYPCIGELELKGRAEGSRDSLYVPPHRLGRLKSDIRERFGVSYERPLCPGIYCGLHVTQTGDCLVAANSGLSCAWFLPDSEVTCIGGIRDEPVERIWERVMRLRTQTLQRTVHRLKSTPAVLGLGGGSIPAQWADAYAEHTRLAARTCL